jgi:hypothetical protein
VLRVAVCIPLLVGAAFLAGCGGGDDHSAPVSVRAPTLPDQPSFRPERSSGAGYPELTKAQAQKSIAVALHDRFVQEVAAGSRVTASGHVAPSVSEGGKKLVGGVVHLALEPPVDFDDQTLPGTISPNQKAPPGTPTLYRFARMSASNVSELEVAVRLADGRAVRIEPSGEGYEVTKLELIGPPPTNPAYASEPGY